MAKKFVRGVTGVDDIEKFDKTLTNVNDLISDGQNTYVHTKKGTTELYYKITDGVKQVESSDELLAITKQDGTVSIGNVGLATKEELTTKVDNEQLQSLLAQKQNTITNNTSIGVAGTGLRQLYASKYTYSNTHGILKTHVKWLSESTNPSSAQAEFNFTVKITKGSQSATFTLNGIDQQRFSSIMTSYGQDNSVRISGLIFTLNGSTLTVTTANSVNHNYVVTFSDII